MSNERKIVEAKYGKVEAIFDGMRAEVLPYQRGPIDKFWLS